VFRILLASLIVRLVLLFALIGRFGLMGAVAAAAGSIAVEEVLYLRATFRRFDLRLADLLHVTWRSMAATAAMAAVLVATGIGWGPAASGTAPLFRDLGIAVGLGAFVYCVVLLLLWQLSGRPRGAETTLLDFIAPLIRRLR
jgi:O-antigen/teichoic acid export membrane protein